MSHMSHMSRMSRAVRQFTLRCIGFGGSHPIPPADAVDNSTLSRTSSTETHGGSECPFRRPIGGSVTPTSTAAVCCCFEIVGQSFATAPSRAFSN